MFVEKSAAFPVDVELALATLPPSILGGRLGLTADGDPVCWPAAVGLPLVKVADPDPDPGTVKVGDPEIGNWVAVADDDPFVPVG